MKTQLLLILLLLLNSLIVFIPGNVVVAGDPNPSGGNIVGDTVYWENSYANLSVYPHTSNEIIRQRQWANLTWKEADNTIDVAFRFNDSLSYGKIWKWDGDSWVKVTMQHTTYNEKHYYYYAGFNVVQDTTYRFKWEYDVPANSSGKWDLFAKLNEHTVQQALDNNWYVALCPWWDGSWGSKIKYTIDPAYIDIDLGNFPVLVNVSAATSALCDEGKSIRFLDSAESVEFAFAFENNNSFMPESWNLIWVNVTYISSTVDTVFYMYFSNDDVADAQNEDGVWDSDYLAVYHLNDTSGSDVYDAAVLHNNSGYSGGNLPSPEDSGKIRTAQYFSGDPDEVRGVEPVHIGDGSGTIEMWIRKETDNNDYMQVYSDADGATNDSANKHYMFFNNNTVYGYGQTSDVHEWKLSSGVVTQNVWNYVAQSFETNNIILAFNDNTFTDTTATPPTHAFTDLSYRIANQHDGANDFIGWIDELRISNISRNSSWMKACYYSQGQTSGFLTTSSIIYETMPRTNDTTGIEETNATAQGWLKDVGNTSGSYTYGFWLGTGLPVEDNLISGGNWSSTPSTIAVANNFSHNFENPEEGTLYYVQAWVLNATHFLEGDNYHTFYTKAQIPGNVTLSIDGCYVDISWDKGDGAVNTVIRRNITSNPTLNNGTEIYNGTGLSFQDTTGSGSQQYYTLWSYTVDKYSDGNVTVNISVPPCPPTSATTNVLSNNTFDITWTVGTSAVATILLRKYGSQSTSPTDGTELYNGTATTININLIEDNWFYTLYSYANETYSTSSNVTVGGMIINCYDEETNESLWFDVSVSNRSGTEFYESYNNTNPHIIDVDDLPLGDDVVIVISASENYTLKNDSFWGFSIDENYTVTYLVLSQIPRDKETTNVSCYNSVDDTYSYPPFTLVDDVITILSDNADRFDNVSVEYEHEEYASRTYYRDINESSFFTLNAYLPDADKKNMYVIRVVGQGEYTNPPVSDADVDIKTSINGTFVTISSLLTDAAGEVMVYLIPDKQYKITVSKDNYDTIWGDYYPDSAFYGANYPKIFQILMTAIEEEEVYTFWDFIRFNATLHTNGSLFVNYIDYNANTTDAQFYIYEHYNFSSTYITTESTTSNTHSFWVTGLNNSREHGITIYLNHTTLGFEIKSIIVGPVDDAKYTEGEIEKKISDAIGPFSLGYVQTFFIYLPIMFFLVLPGKGHPGFAIIMASIYAGFASSFIVVGSILMIVPFAIAIGVILMAVKGGMLKL